MNNPLSSCLTISILSLALSASAVMAQESTNTENSKTTRVQKNKPLPISKEARAALKQAAAIAAKSKGLKGKARSSALTAGAKAYEAVAAKFGSEAGACGQAWFRAAELWRRSLSLESAAKAYGLAVDRDPRRYQERSWLQLAHLERRQKRTEEALELYKKVARLKSGTARTHEARLWIGRCLEAQKKADAAVDAYRQALSLTTKPRRVVDVCNRLALCLVQQGKLDQAAAAIRQAETTAASVLDKKGPSSKSLRRALDRMSARKALQRARDKATGAHRDAKDLDRGH